MAHIKLSKNSVLKFFNNEVGVTYKTAWRVMACVKRSHDPDEQSLLDKLNIELEKMIAKK